jgi:hypothetical protein
MKKFQLPMKLTVAFIAHSSMLLFRKGCIEAAKARKKDGGREAE